MKTINLNEIAQKARDYHSSGTYSCSESVFLTLTEVFDIPISKDFYGISSSFSGGALCGSLCGASSGALMTIGLIFGSEEFGKDKTKNKARIIAKEFTDEFIKNQGSPECRVILADFEMGTPKQHDKCFGITSSTAFLAAKIIGEELGYQTVS